MAKNIVQDVMPRSGRKSIREIPLSGGNRDNSYENSVYADENSGGRNKEVNGFHYNNQSEEEIADWTNDNRSRLARWIIWIIGIASFGALIFVIGNIFFSGATLIVTPKFQTVQINLNLTAKANTVPGDLSYASFSLVREKEMRVPADGEKTVELKASGKIVIYNNYSTVQQRLVKNTRFETPDGLIYRINDSITIPGRHSVDGKIIPGSIEVSVYAESSGEEYNIGLTDFTVPGFKSNAARFASFYARSKTPMTGGKIGVEKSLSEEKTFQVRAKLDAELVSELVAEARVHLPDDSIFYDGAYRVSFEPVSASPDKTKNTVTVRERARFIAYFIKHNDLAQTIAQTVPDNFGDSLALVPDDENLVFQLVDKNVSNATSLGPIEFNLKGNATIVWQVDKNKLVAELASKNKNQLAETAARYPGILKVEAVIRPFWKNEFPRSVSKIKVETRR